MAETKTAVKKPAPREEHVLKKGGLIHQGKERAEGEKIMVAPRSVKRLKDNGFI